MDDMVFIIPKQGGGCFMEKSKKNGDEKTCKIKTDSELKILRTIKAAKSVLDLISINEIEQRIEVLMEKRVENRNIV